MIDESKGDLAVRSEGGFSAAIDPALDDELLAEGLAREVVNRTQRLRKDSGLEITDRIRLGVFGPESVQDAVRHHEGFICGETLAIRFVVGDRAQEEFDFVTDVDLEGAPVSIRLSRGEAAKTE